MSIGPILAVPGMREALAAARARGAAIAAVSPIIGGKALKGPADRMLTSLGMESSAVGVARHYADVVDAFVIDAVDAALVPAIEALGVRRCGRGHDHGRRGRPCPRRPFRAGRGDLGRLTARGSTRPRPARGRPLPYHP